MFYCMCQILSSAASGSNGRLSLPNQWNPSVGISCSNSGYHYFVQQQNGIEEIFEKFLQILKRKISKIL